MPSFFLILSLVLVSFAAANPDSRTQKPVDYAPAKPGDHYDWRHTHWFGVSGGTATGSGLSYRYWGERNGWQLTLLPFAYFGEHSLLVAGAARLFSLNTPPAASAGSLRNHYFWFLSSGHGWRYHSGGNGYLGSVGGGIGMDLNRRVSRFTLMLGIGPYLGISPGSDPFLRMYPTFEIGWHFGMPNRSSP